MKEPIFASDRPSKDPLRVSETILYECDGPYKTKTGADLYVSWVLPNGNNGLSLPGNLTLEKFMDFDKNEERELLEHFRREHPLYTVEGLSADRFYFQPNIPMGAIAGNEFHRIRREILLPVSGRLEVELEDVYGDRRTIDLSVGGGLIIQPFIMHTIYAMEKSATLCRANTIFMVGSEDDKVAIPDTYSRETFNKLKEKFS